MTPTPSVNKTDLNPISCLNNSHIKGVAAGANRAWPEDRSLGALRGSDLISLDPESPGILQWGRGRPKAKAWFGEEFLLFKR
jgi:hypothetical protein